MTKVVYVTGCLGFIGSYVTRACLHKGWYVKGIDKMTYASNKDLLSEFETYENFSFIKSDINDLNRPMNLLPPPILDDIEILS